ncbi:MAG: hypothetical protein PHP32_02185 [Candidatus Izemoplasmatales bacterium]|nr:hypothetical protein [Candidatus Izemoplasmatales bacterium]
MKRLFSVFLLFGLVFILSACDVTTTSPKEGTNTTTTTLSSSTTTTTEDESADLAYLKNKLLDAGYDLDKRDDDSVAYYNANAVNAAYGIDVEVTEVYLGYVNQVEHWAELIGFDSVEDAQTYASAVDATGAEGLLYFRYGQAVVITYAQETIDALS